LHWLFIIKLKPGPLGQVTGNRFYQLFVVFIHFLWCFMLFRVQRKRASCGLATPLQKGTRVIRRVVNPHRWSCGLLCVYTPCGCSSKLPGF